MDCGADSYRRFLNGDDTGFVEIVRDYKDGLIFYINSYVNNLYIAEELAEDTFVKLGIKKPKHTHKASFKTWLYTIGRNIAIDYLRKNSKYNIVSIHSCNEIVSDMEDLENNYLKQEHKIILYNAISKLKDEYRQILNLIYFEDFNNKEAAIIMKKSVHNIETLVYRARLALRLELDKEGFKYENL